MYPPTPDLLRNLHFPVHSSAQGPPRGLCLAIRREIHQVMQLPILQAMQRGKQRRVRLLKRLLKRRAIQRRIQPRIQVEIKVETQVPTYVPTRRATQVRIRADIHREIRRRIQGDVRRETRGILDLGFQIGGWEEPGVECKERNPGFQESRNLVAGTWRLCDLVVRSGLGPKCAL